MSTVLARTRVAVGLAGGAAAAGATAVVAPWQVAALVGWDCAALVVLVWVWVTISAMDSVRTAQWAAREDDSRAAADIVLVAASVASLFGVGLGLVKAAQKHGSIEALITAAAVVTVVLSWAAVHTIFTLHYARLYYTQGGGGIDFHDDRQPDYGDFAYVAFTIGMTYQVSDTDLSGKAMRSTALRHALLSYLFGTAVIAMTINVVAALLR